MHDLKNCEQCSASFTPSYKPQRFCSKACSNKGVHRRVKKEAVCSFEGCNNIVDYYTHIYCRACINEKRHLKSKWNGRLVHEVSIEEYCKRKGANKFDSIRAHARASIKRSNVPLVCEQCGWDHHVEVCHIKAIASFAPTTPVSVVNEISNLKLLCPNCHWLFDHQK